MLPSNRFAEVLARMHQCRNRSDSTGAGYWRHVAQVAESQASTAATLLAQVRKES